jgi:hypothetical protein
VSGDANCCGIAPSSVRGDATARRDVYFRKRSRMGGLNSFWLTSLDARGQKAGSSRGEVSGNVSEEVLRTASLAKRSWLKRRGLLQHGGYEGRARGLLEFFHLLRLAIARFFPTIRPLAAIDAASLTQSWSTQCPLVSSWLTKVLNSKLSSRLNFFKASGQKGALVDITRGGLIATSMSSAQANSLAAGFSTTSGGAIKLIRARQGPSRMLPANSCRCAATAICQRRYGPRSGRSFKRQRSRWQHW